MNACLAEMTPEEIEEALWYVEVFEKGGTVPSGSGRVEAKDRRLAAVPGARPAHGHA